MWAALGWGLFAGSSLILGGVLALTLPIRERVLGLIMGFGSGVLISAVAYELVAEAFETSAGNGGIALGLDSRRADVLRRRPARRPDGRREPQAASARPPERGPPSRSCSGSSSTASPSRR